MTDEVKQGERLRRRSYELSVLRDVAQAVNASVDLSSLLGRTLAKVAELLGLETGWVLLLDESTGRPYAAATQNLPPGLREEPERMTGRCFCLDAFAKGDLPGAANIGVVKCSRLRQLSMAEGDTAGLRFHASIPLKVRDGKADGEGVKRLGMLNVASPKWREITDDELDLLRAIGGLLGVAVERAQLHARRVEAAQTEERLRLAREIHDTIAQDFSAIAMQLDTAEVLIEQEAELERIGEQVRVARDFAAKGLQDTRRSVFDLRAAPLEGQTLPEALSALADEADATDAPVVVFEGSPAIRMLPPGVEVSLYRIGQEALQNALRHASASRITLSLERSPGALRLRIEDDGQGFDSDAVLSGDRASGRFGLLGMRERARLIGGRLDVESTAGVGTRITAEVPLPADDS